MFRSIKIDGWRQFNRIDIKFHPRLTVLTGANSAGKTTLLSLISRHLGWSTSFISTPKSRSSSNIQSYSADTWDLEKLGDVLVDEIIDRDISRKMIEFAFDENLDRTKFNSLDVIRAYAEELILKEKKLLAASTRFEGPMVTIGSIKYSSGQEAKLQIPQVVGQQVYEVNISNQQNVEGVHISSHRTIYSYQQIQSIPTAPRRRNDVFNNYVNILRTRLSGGHTQWSPQYYMKETLISLATFGYGNQAVDADIESAQIFEDFQKILQIMLPRNLGFRKITIRVPEVILETDTGNFPIDALSGGSSAIVDLAWQIFMFQPTTGNFVVTLDEPENHLHPELQRRVLSDLITAFPMVQFVVATHSPFVVSSVPDSAVYVLAYNEDKSVSSHLLDAANKAGNANEILREVLGVDITIPIWAENHLKELVEKYSTRNFDKETLGELKSELNHLGMGNQIPQAVASLAAIKDSQ